MELEFTRREDGIIDARFVDDVPLMNHALEDAVSTRAPRGAKPGLSTYWIDLAEQGARAAMASRSTTPFASGNVTYLWVDRDQVFAAYDFDDPPDGPHDAVPLPEFLELLRRWRIEVIDAGGASGADAQPQTDARPMPPPS